MIINNLTLNSPIDDLSSKASATAEKLKDANIKSIEDLLWTLPRKIIKLPEVKSFSLIKPDEFFRGNGKILSIQARPNFKARGKGKAMLYNINVVVKDMFSEGIINLKWFNCYSSIQKKLSSLSTIDFLGVATEFNETIQIVNPEYCELGQMEIQNGLRIQYPTISSINSVNLKKFIDKVPMYLWDNLPEVLPAQIIEKHNFLNRSQAFKYLHGKIDPNLWDEDEFEKAKDRLIYEEFFLDQIKIDLRKKTRALSKSPAIDLENLNLNEYYSLYPYELTQDQKNAIIDIVNDLKSGHPMMRLIQGDVGCGKTTVAVISCLIMIYKGYQASIMCPTEALALQHFEGISNLCGDKIKVQLLLGSQSAKEKTKVLEALANGEIDLIIGTHALFQESVGFKNLGICVIDEQHKFGVEQRLKLTSKGNGTHCIIMSATPIPRSLSLTQYGDLDISIIKNMPSGRKGVSTRIVNDLTYDKYLSFIKTRLEMKEQAYILVPAINENTEININDLNNTLELYKKYFPEFRISGLHGQMKAEEKNQVLSDFKNHKIDLLVATSVIEVGINVINSTIMAILNPERFGLSSLHQMRGRVGRGEKPGFCFLVTDKKLAPESLNRLKVIEDNTDGFKIAEEDLKIRGEGDLFGAEQSGIVTQKRIANIVIHQDILYSVILDFKSVNTSELDYLKQKVLTDEKILSTI